MVGPNSVPPDQELGMVEGGAQQGEVRDGRQADVGLAIDAIDREARRQAADLEVIALDPRAADRAEEGPQVDQQMGVHAFDLRVGHGRQALHGDRHLDHQVELAGGRGGQGGDQQAHQGQCDQN